MAELEFAFDDVPEPGQRTSVVDGIDWIRLPLPFRLNHVNCWWLDDGAGHAVQIDTGVASDTTRKHWSQVLGKVRPDTLLVTHFHPDHAGLAGEYAAAGVRLLSSEIEMNLCARIWHTEPDDYGALYAEWYRQNGIDESTALAVAQAGNSYRRIVVEPPRMSEFTWLDDGTEIELGGRRWQVMHGGGHAPAMLMLFCDVDRILIAADQVLPGISPNISAGPVSKEHDESFGLREPNPLARFLETLERLRSLPEDTLVLPSHGMPFRGLHMRIAELVAHHDDRLNRVREACVVPRTAADLFDVLFGKKLDAQQMSFALGESLAHAEHLRLEGRLDVDHSTACTRYLRR